MLFKNVLNSTRYSPIRVAEAIVNFFTGTHSKPFDVEIQSK